MSAPRWDLSNLFVGGLEDPAFQQAASTCEATVERMLERAEALPSIQAQSADSPELAEWCAWLVEAQVLQDQVHELGTYTGCLRAANTGDPKAEQANTRTAAIWNRLSRAWVPVQDGLAFGGQVGFDALLTLPALKEQRPLLQRYREQGALLLPRGEQALATELARDGINAWGRVYTSLSGTLKAKMPEGERSVGQVANLIASPDAQVRDQAFGALKQAWTGAEQECARVLTHIVGTRQTLNDRRGLDELADTLAANRLERGSLDAMLEAAGRARPLLLRYIALKGKLLGVGQLSWEDLAAPLPSSSATQTWDQAQDFILTHFGAYHPELRDFAARAFSQGWVEAEDRGAKGAGAWCARAPLAGESRVFMTYGGSFRGTVTLAHELGHAFHNHATRHLPASRRAIPSTLAETASIFAESLVRDAALKAAADKASKMSMLDARLMAGVSFLMNIPMRYELERSLYQMRRQGPLVAQAISEQTVALQRRWYGDSLAEYDPTFWASKLHFYISGRAFYNYPYTYGYLFAQLVYRQVMERGRSAHADYVALLERTGWQQGEALAMETLGLDLRSADTWWAAIAPLEQDLQALEALAAQ